MRRKGSTPPTTHHLRQDGLIPFSLVRPALCVLGWKHLSQRACARGDRLPMSLCGRAERPSYPITATPPNGHGGGSQMSGRVAQRGPSRPPIVETRPCAALHRDAADLDGESKVVQGDIISKHDWETGTPRGIRSPQRSCHPTRIALLRHPVEKLRPSLSAGWASPITEPIEFLARARKPAHHFHPRQMGVECPINRLGHTQHPSHRSDGLRGRPPHHVQDHGCQSFFRQPL